MIDVKIENLIKRYDRTEVLKGIDLLVDEGEMVTLLGPSGCGKSTTLRILAGLEEHQDGEVSFNGQLMSSPKKGVFVPPEKRQLGMVFQSYAIWPHMSVYENIAFPLKTKKESATNISRKVRHALNLVGLENYSNRSTTQLSGGQQQRVALARAIVSEPRVFLLDEPLSNLDAKLREQMRVELKILHRHLGLTTIYVTHDQEESLSLSDKIVVMNQGQIEQMGTPKEVYEKPRNLFVSNFVGASNYLPGIVTAIDGDQYTVDIEIGGEHFRLTSSNVYLPIEKDQKVLFVVRPEHLRVRNQIDDLSGMNILPFTVKQRLYLGSHFEYTFELGDHSWNLKLPADIAFKKDERVEVTFPFNKSILLPVEH